MVKIQFCQCCGAVIPPPALFAGRMQEIFAYIAKHPGCSVEQVFCHVYGPYSEYADTNVLVYISKIRKRLPELGLVLERVGRPAEYTLRKLPLVKGPVNAPSDVSTILR